MIQQLITRDSSGFIHINNVCVLCPKIISKLSFKLLDIFLDIQLKQIFSQIIEQNVNHIIEHENLKDKQKNLINLLKDI